MYGTKLQLWLNLKKPHLLPDAQPVFPAVRVVWLLNCPYTRVRTLTLVSLGASTL